MKFYIDKYDDLLTEKQFKEQYLNKDALLDGYFQNEFIELCSHCPESYTIKKILNLLIEQLQEDEELFLDYLEYWDIEKKEIDNKKIIEALKES